MGKNREELNEEAREVGIEGPEAFDTKADLTAAIQAAEQNHAQQEVPVAVQVFAVPDGEGGEQVVVQRGEATKPAEVPSLLRIAAKVAEQQLGIG